MCVCERERERARESESERIESERRETLLHPIFINCWFVHIGTFTPLRKSMN